METKVTAEHQLFLRRITAVAAVGIFLAVCTCVCAEETDAETQPDLFMIPGFEHRFAVKGDVATSGPATVEFIYCPDYTAASAQLRVSGDKLTDDLTIDENNKYRYGFRLYFADPSQVEADDVAKLTIKITDFAGQDDTVDYFFHVVEPSFEVPSSNKNVRQGERCNTDTLLDKHGALEGDAAFLFSESTSLYCNGNSYPVSLSGRYMTVPYDLPVGKNSYQLKLALTGPVKGGSLETKTYMSSAFDMTVSERPVITVGSSFECIAKDPISVPMTLKDNSMAGNWTVQKRAGSSSDIAHGSGESSVFSIPNTASGDSGTYDVFFKLNSGSQSETKTFTLKVYTPVASGVVGTTGLVSDGHGGLLLQAGEQNNRTCMHLDSMTGFRFEVENSTGQDATNLFDIGADGNITVHAGTPAGKYTLRFYSDSTDKVQVETAELVYKAPPKIYTVAPYGEFTIL